MSLEWLRASGPKSKVVLCRFCLLFLARWAQRTATFCCSLDEEGLLTPSMFKMLWCFRCVCWLSLWNQLGRSDKRLVWRLKRRRWRRSSGWALPVQPKGKLRSPAKVLTESLFVFPSCFYGFMLIMFFCFVFVTMPCFAKTRLLQCLQTTTQTFYCWKVNPREKSNQRLQPRHQQLLHLRGSSTKGSHLIQPPRPAWPPVWAEWFSSQL